MTDDIVMVQSYSNASEANLFKGMLEAAGVRAEIISDDAGGLYPQLQAALGVRLMVRREDLDRAREILEENA